MIAILLIQVKDGLPQMYFYHQPSGELHDRLCHEDRDLTRMG